MPILVIGNKNQAAWSMRPWVLMLQTGILVFEERHGALAEQDFPGFEASCQRAH